MFATKISKRYGFELGFLPLFMGFFHLFMEESQLQAEKMKKGARTTTSARHKAVYGRFLEIQAELRKTGYGNSVYLADLYSKVGEETGYSEDSVCRIVNKFRRER